MAELLVRTKDKVSEDYYLNAQCSKRGDVITVQEDGWPWTEAELSFPEWVIIKIPKAPVSDFINLLAPEQDISFAQPSKTLQRRAFKLDLDALSIPEPIVTKELEPTVTIDRTAKDRIYDSKSVDLQTYKIAKPRIADPDILGDAPEIWQPL